MHVHMYVYASVYAWKYVCTVLLNSYVANTWLTFSQTRTQLQILSTQNFRFYSNTEYVPMLGP